MKRTAVLCIIIVLAALIPDSKAYASERFDINKMNYYTDIPDVTEEDIAAVETLKASRDSFSYGHLIQTESFMTPEGEYAGFTIKLCDLLTELFGIRFEHTPYNDWEDLKSNLDSGLIDFTGGITKTPERLRNYYMTHPIAERSLSIYTLTDSPEIKSEQDVNDLRLGFFKGTITSEYVKYYYPSLSFETVYIEATVPMGVKMLKSGEIDAFVVDSVMDPSFEQYDFIRSKVFFPLVYTSVSMTAANPELAPIISVMDKYIIAGGIDRLYEMYKEGDYEYAKYKLNKTFTDEEKAYIKALAAKDMLVETGFEPDNYPFSFYNKSDKEFQGIAVDVLKEISNLTGIRFEETSTRNATWPEIFEKLKSGEISMVTQLLYSDERKESFIWASVPYSTAHYALLSKEDHPDVAMYQVFRNRVGLLEKTAYTDMYNMWFPDSDNTTVYHTHTQVFDALEKGEIDLFMATDYMLLYQTNYREKPGYRVNLDLNIKSESFFGFNKEEELLRSVVDKAQAFVDTDYIESTWANRLFDYEKKMAGLGMRYMSIFVIILLLVLLLTTYLFLKYKRAEEDALVASKAKGAFLAHMSHEIRTPLHAIIGMAGIAKNSISGNEKALSSIEQIITSSHHLLGILNNVLDMSKIESGKLELICAPYSLFETYDETSAIITQRCREKNIQFNTNIHELKNVIVIGDKLRMNQILINLLGNAVKFTGENGEVSLTVQILEETDENIEIEFLVSDNGMGMTKEQIDKLFIPFEQTDSSISTKYGGTGLGLSISQSLVKMMGGEIKVESSINNGSKFHFELCFKKEAEAADGAQEEAGALDLKGKQILIVEDIEVNKLILCELLSPTEASIDEAGDGQEAVDMFSGSAPGYYDLIFMDVQMPVMGGYEATRQIRLLKREDAKTVKIIAMTANAYKEDIDKSLEAGMNGHLSKPVDTTAMMATLKEFIG